MLSGLIPGPVPSPRRYPAGEVLPVCWFGSGRGAVRQAVGNRILEMGLPGPTGSGVRGSRGVRLPHGQGLAVDYGIAVGCPAAYAAASPAPAVRHRPHVHRPADDDHQAQRLPALPLHDRIQEGD